MTPSTTEVICVEERYETALNLVAKCQTDGQQIGGFAVILICHYTAFRVVIFLFNEFSVSFKNQATFVTHTHIYIYIYICVCVCVCLRLTGWLSQWILVIVKNGVLFNQSPMVSFLNFISWYISKRFRLKIKQRSKTAGTNLARSK